MSLPAGMMGVLELRSNTPMMMMILLLLLLLLLVLLLLLLLCLLSQAYSSW